MDPDDRTLLSSYVTNRSEAAFTALVRRYLKLVYHAALRQTGGRQTLAEEVAQAVFTDLARKAGSLLDRPVLTGWLYTSTRFAAAKALRSESRRRIREKEAVIMDEITVPHQQAHVDWERLRPAIDDALHTLEEMDREAVLLRFLEGRAFAEIGAALKLSEEAARKRVDRALDKLHRALTRRGIASTSAALSVALTQFSAATVPSGLDATIVGTALRAPLAGSALGSGAMVALILLLVGGAAWYYDHVQQHAISVEKVRRENAALQLRVQETERNAVELKRQADAAEHDKVRLTTAIRAASLAGVVDEEASRAAFVIDTSGSMRDPREGGLYAAVVTRLDQILKVNSHLRYFQVFDGDGRYVIADTSGKWLRNDDAAREMAKTTLRRYNRDTVSNPVPGVQAALQALDAGRDPLSRLHIFVLGDELNSQDHSDLLLAQIGELNPADAKGKRRVTISAVGFPTWEPHVAKAGEHANPSAPLSSTESGFTRANPPRTFVRFNRLMTELAIRHGGTFATANTLVDEP